MSLYKYIKYITHIIVQSEMFMNIYIFIINIYVYMHLHRYYVYIPIITSVKIYYISLEKDFFMLFPRVQP